MLKIIHSFTIGRLLKSDVRKDITSSFIILDTKSWSDKYSDMLKLKGMSEIRVEEIDDEVRKVYEIEYINGIAELSSAYSSIEWWANSVSEKNEHVSSHYKHLCLYDNLIKTLKKYVDININVFIVCNNEIFEQLKVFCYHNGIKISSLEKIIILWMKMVYGKIYRLLKIVYVLSQIFMRKICIPNELKLRIKEEINNVNNCYAIRTWIDKRFLVDDEVYRDAYFGRLPEYLIKNKYEVIILAGIINNYKKVLKKIKNTKNILFIPVEFFFRYSDFYRLLVHVFFRRINIQRKVLFNDLDVSILYQREMASGCFNAAYLRNVFSYIVARRFAELVKFKAYIQTFENYAWEKLMILGIREIRPEVKIFAFQHAFISKNSFKYFHGIREKGVIPLPDKIITMGKVTKEMLERFGNYNSNILSVGCALRQEYIDAQKPFKKRRFNKVVVPLTMVKRESVLIMNFLYDSGIPQTDIKVVIRCHPAAPFESFKKYIDFRIPENFIINNEKNVNEELSTTDIVLYTWTTVAVEALKLGLPVIYLDILKPMYIDPLFECSSLKRTVSKPDKLLLTIKALYDMSDTEFYHEQALAQGYLKGYFYPVTAENLAPFLPDSKPYESIQKN